jgi:hypothetical protein
MIVTSSLAIIAGWLMCAVFTKGKLEDEYWRGYNRGYEQAMRRKYKMKSEWQSDYTK